jgi:hypothetical protein
MDMSIFWKEMIESGLKILMIFGFLVFLGYATQGDFSEENKKNTKNKNK